LWRIIYLPQALPLWNNTCTGSVPRFICSSRYTHHVFITFVKPLWGCQTHSLKSMSQNIYLDSYNKAFFIVIWNCWCKYFKIWSNIWDFVLLRVAGVLTWACENTLNNTFFCLISRTFCLWQHTEPCFVI
jgi:hypothetical protein